MKVNELKEYRETLACQAFIMIDWKVMFIFLGWAALLGLTIFVFLAVNISKLCVRIPSPHGKIQEIPIKWKRYYWPAIPASG